MGLDVADSTLEAAVFLRTCCGLLIINVNIHGFATFTQSHYNFLDWSDELGLLIRDVVLERITDILVEHNGMHVYGMVGGCIDHMDSDRGHCGQ